MSQTTTSRRARPLLIWDGDCGFCRFWVHRWAAVTGDAVTYAPSQAVRASFPDIPAERFERSIVLVEPDGRLRFGADAAFEALGKGRGWGWLPKLVRGVPGLSALSEGAYSVVARNRRLFSRVTRALWGGSLAGGSWTVGPWVFLRVLALVYLVHFLSTWTQVHGLIGSEGLLPVSDHFAAAREHLGGDAVLRLPSLLWISSSDAMLTGLCAAGVLLSLLLMVGVAPAPCLVLAWACHLSLVTAGQEFLSFQWDSLLLEVGLLAIFLAPLRVRPTGTTGTAAIPRFLLWWLNFRLLTLSGAVKLASGDEAWHRSTAMDFHHFTQPLPGPFAWFFHHLPSWFHRLEVRATFALELFVPFLIWAPRRIRHVAALALIALQVVIGLSGNYGYFNLLAIALCLLLFDDAAWPRRLRRLLLFGPGAGRTPRRELRWHGRVLGPFALLVLALTTAAFVDRLNPGSLPDWTRPVRSAFAPLRSFNSYGLFAVMTTSRPELVVEGSLDGEEWRAYPFRWKPGDPKRMPRQVAPHMPRLDWQAWFAALSSPRSRRAAFMHRLEEAILEGRPEVLALLGPDPFDGRPPRFVRIRLFEYRFSSWDELREEGRWWSREERGLWSSRP